MANPNSAATLYVDVKINSVQIQQELNKTRANLKNQASLISKDFIKNFNSISNAAVKMGRQVSGVIKAMTAPALAFAGFSVKKLFGSTSLAGREVRSQWEPLKKSIDESMVKIGYYITKSKIFGKTMWEWIEKFGNILRRVTQEDVQKFVKLLSGALTTLLAIKSTVMAIKFTQGTLKALEAIGAIGGGSSLSGLGAGVGAAGALSSKEISTRIASAKYAKSISSPYAIWAEQLAAQATGAGGAGVAVKTGMAALAGVVTAAIAAIFGELAGIGVIINAYNGKIKQNETATESALNGLKTGGSLLLQGLAGAWKVIEGVISAAATMVAYGMPSKFGTPEMEKEVSKAYNSPFQSWYDLKPIMTKKQSQEAIKANYEENTGRPFAERYSEQDYLDNKKKNEEEIAKMYYSLADAGSAYAAGVTQFQKAMFRIYGNGMEAVASAEGVLDKYGKKLEEMKNKNDEEKKVMEESIKFNRDRFRKEKEIYRDFTKSISELQKETGKGILELFKDMQEPMGFGGEYMSGTEGVKFAQKVQNDWVKREADFKKKMVDIQDKQLQATNDIVDRLDEAVKELKQQNYYFEEDLKSDNPLAYQF